MAASTQFAVLDRWMFTHPASHSRAAHSAIASSTGWHVGRRRGDDPQHLGRGRLLLQRLGQLLVPLLKLLEQARVLDGDDRLVRERLEQARSGRSVNGPDVPL